MAGCLCLVRPEGFEPPAYCSVVTDVDWGWFFCALCGAEYVGLFGHRCSPARSMLELAA